jgi:hypothetical protein
VLNVKEMRYPALPIYKLVMNNLYAKSGLESVGSKDLITSVRDHNTEVARLLSETGVQVNKVEA